MSWRFPTSKSELDAAAFVAREFPKKFKLEQRHYLESMCIHWVLWEIKKNGMTCLMSETVHTYFGKPARELEAIT